MNNKSSDNVSISEELDSISGALKERIEDYRRKEDQSINQFFFKFIGLFMKNRGVLGKQSLSNADIQEVNKSVIMDTVYDQVHRTIEDMINSDKLKDESAGSVFELYDTMIAKIIGPGRLLVAVLETVSTFIAFGCFSLVYRLFIYLKSPEPWFNYRGVLYLAGLLVLVGINRALDRLSERIADKIAIKKNLAMTVLVYYKLLASDISFLESADNNLIYRAFYWDLEEYSNFQSNFVPALIVPVMLIIHIVVGRYIPGVTTFNYYSYQIFTILVFSVILGSIRSLTLWKYRQILTKERETIYEWLVNVKSARFSNMKKRFTDKLEQLQKSRLEVLNKLYNNYLTTYYMMKHGEFLIPVAMLIYMLVKYWKELREGKLIDDTYPEAGFFNHANILCWVVVYVYYDGKLKKEIHQLECFFRSRVSKTFYDQYFGNDSVINRVVTVDTSLGLGEIQIQDCTVLMREQVIDKQDIASLFPDTGSLSELSESKPNMTLNSINNSGKANNPNKRDYYFIRVIDNLTLKVASGERLCIEATKEHLAITGFFRLLIGEAFVSKGSMRVNGGVSYFNREKMAFLVGKTIRDNILFGEEFDSNRYDSVLNTLRVKFDQYLGRDFYQITENGLNLKSDDRLLILLARFLYKDCKIYIAEDLFMDVNFVIVNPIFDRIMAGFFQGKTLIFMSNVPIVISTASSILRLKKNYKYEVHVPSRDILKKEAGKGNPQKVFTTQGKIGNFIFIQNLSYVEELAIHKKLKQQKEVIDAKMMSNTNIVEKIAYGIYLTNKRRQEGTNIEELKEVTPTELMEFTMSFLKKKGSLRTLLFSTLLVTGINSLLMAIVEYFLLSRIYDNVGTRKGITMGWTDMIVIVTLYFVSSIVGFVHVYWYKKLTVKLISKLNSGTRSHIIDGSFSKLYRMRYHEVLSRVNEHLPSIEIKTFTMILMLSENACVIFWYFFILICTYSVVMPLVIICLFIFAWTYTLSRLMPFYFKAISFAYHNQHKKDDFNVQLLSTILGYRITGCLKKLNTKFLKLSDNLSRSDNLVRTDYKSMFMKINTLYSMMFSLAIVATIFVNFNIKTANFLNIPDRSLVWGLVVLYRVYLKKESFIKVLLDGLGETLKIYKFWSFLPLSSQNYETNSKPKYSYRYMPPDPDYTKPIVLRNISLTLGYKPVLKKINIKIKPMQRVGILGFEGCGRSSIFDLIMGAKEKDSQDNSEISLFGIKLEYVSEENIRNQMYFLSGKPLMLGGTVRENIDTYSQFTDETIIDLLKELQIDKILRKEAWKNQIKINSGDVDEDKSQQREAFRLAINHARVSIDSKVIQPTKTVPAIKINKIKPLAKASFNSSLPETRKVFQNKVIMNIKLDNEKDSPSGLKEVTSHKLDGQ